MFSLIGRMLQSLVLMEGHFNGHFNGHVGGGIVMRWSV